MVTLPTEAAQNYQLVRELVQRGTDCMRINCAHDNAECWLAMINHPLPTSSEYALRARCANGVLPPREASQRSYNFQGQNNGEFKQPKL